MDQINKIVSSNIRHIRKSRGLSLDQMAKQTDVSKSMLSQIERGAVVPTISTIWKISNGLNLSFTDLVTAPQKEVVFERVSDVDAIVGDDGKYRNYPLYKINDRDRVEVYYIELDKGALLEGYPHPEGTVECLVVFSGELTVEVNDKKYEVPNGSSLRFIADRPHVYRGVSDEVCRLSMIISYKK